MRGGDIGYDILNIFI